MKSKLLLLSTLISSSIMAQDMATLNKRLDILAEEIETMKMEGPSSSSVHIGGYGEIVYKHASSKDQSGNNLSSTPGANGQRFILYVGKKFDSKWKLTSEIEIEDTDAIFVEQATLDYSYSEKIKFSAGIMLIPVGITNLYHEPTTFYGVSRTLLENKIIPATWREIGISLSGQISDFSYQFAVVNGLDASKFTSDKLRGGRYKGKFTNFDKASMVARLDYRLLNTVLGASAYIGHAVGATTPVSHNFYDFHLTSKFNGFKVRALYALSTIGNTKELNTEVGNSNTNLIASELSGYYGEIGYNVLRGIAEWSLEPFVRYETLDTQAKLQAGGIKDLSKDQKNIVVGLSVYPNPNVVLKADYVTNTNKKKTGQNSFNMGIGWNF